MISFKIAGDRRVFRADHDVQLNGAGSEDMLLICIIGNRPGADHDLRRVFMESRLRIRLFHKIRIGDILPPAVIIGSYTMNMAFLQKKRNNFV